MTMDTINQRPAAGTCGLTARDVTVRAGRKYLLRGASCSVRPGWITAAVGENGAGKSTLLRALANEIHPRGGEVLLDGLPVRSMAAAELARLRAVMPQSSNLTFPFRAEEVAAMGRAPFDGLVSAAENRKIVLRAMRAAGAETLRGREYTNLSGGEQQRVQMARVLAQIIDARFRKDRYLLLDEPLSNLDLRRQHETMEMLRDLAREGVGVLIVLHDLNLAAWYADWVIVLRDGSVLAGAPPEDALRPDRVEAAFGHPVLPMAHPESGRPMVVPRVRPFTQSPPPPAAAVRTEHNPIP